jgi:predicted Zn-dependent protease
LPVVRVTIADSIGGDTRLQSYVACIAENLVMASPRLPADKYVHIHIRDDHRINAAALSNNRIDVNTGLIDITSSDDQLAAVIAHELAHQVLGHPARRQSLAYTTGAGDQLASNLAHDRPGTASGIRAAFHTAWQVATMPLRRSQENSADRLGLDFAANAGFEPGASIDLWYTLDTMYDDSSRPVFSPHPSNRRRVQALKKHLPGAQKIYRRTARNYLSTHCKW